jgi:hypothetical protein
MTHTDRITLVIEGLPEDRGRVRFNTFMSQLQSLSGALSKLDRETNKGAARTYFEIAELSYSSPIRVSLEPHSAVADQGGHRIIAGLESFANALSAKGNLADFDADILEEFQKLANPVGRQVKSATLLFNGNSFDLTQEIASTVKDALSTVDECDGAVDGMLEQINVHHAANTFHIYPLIGPKKITCKFPSRLYDDAVSAVGRRVEVRGLLQYRASAEFPYQVAASEIDIFESEDELPDWEDIRGMAPDATGKLTSEAFVRELRDAWL